MTLWLHRVTVAMKSGINAILRSLPPHPAIRTRRRLWGVAGLFAFAGAIGAWGKGLGFVLLCASGSAFSFFLGWFAARSARPVQLVNLALAQLTRGKIEEAEAILGEIPPAAETTYVGRSIALQRAMIALQRGDLEGAVTQIARTVEPKPGLLTRHHDEFRIATGLALRALARASLGQQEEALRDAELAEQSPAATPEVVAMARLARAVLLSRTGDLLALRHYLATSGDLLEWLAPRERALMRALRDMARAKPA
jgi:hypothetical protein